MSPSTIVSIIMLNVVGTETSGGVMLSLKLTLSKNTQAGRTFDPLGLRECDIVAVPLIIHVSSTATVLYTPGCKSLTVAAVTKLAIA